MKILEHNVATGKIIEREMNSQELNEWENFQEKIKKQKMAETEAEAARAALLDKLGITEEEAKLLLS